MEDNLGTVLDHDRMHALGVGDIGDQRVDRDGVAALAELKMQTMETILVLIEQHELARRERRDLTAQF